MIRNAVLITIAMGLVVGLSLAGCGNKKPGEGGADAGDGKLDEADTGPRTGRLGGSHGPPP